MGVGQNSVGSTSSAQHEFGMGMLTLAENGVAPMERAKNASGRGSQDGAFVRRGSFASGDEPSLQAAKEVKQLPLMALPPPQPQRRHSNGSASAAICGGHSEAVSPLATSASVPRLVG